MLNKLMMYDSFKVCLFGVSVAFIFLYLLFTAVTVKADTVSGNQQEETQEESGEESYPEDEEHAQDFQTDQADSETSGQPLYMDQELTNSVVAFQNFSYKIDLVNTILLVIITGCMIALLIVLWFVR